MWAFLFHSFISLLLSPYFIDGWGAWKNFSRSIVITYFMIVLITDYTKLRLVFLILVLFLGAEGAKQGWVYLITTPGWGANPNSIPFLGDNNGVAVGMLMLVPIVALLAQTTQRRWARFGFWFLLIGVLFRALSTYSRGGFLACIALGGTYWLRSRKKLRVLLGMAIVVAIVLPSLTDTYWERMNTISSSSTKDEASTNAEQQDGSVQGRLHFWRVAVAMANANPLLGVGHYCYLAAYNAYDFSNGLYGQRRAVHSSFFGVLAEGGYVGSVLYGLIVYSAWRSCQRVRKLTTKHPTLLPLAQSATALETSLVVFLVGGSFLTFQYIELVWHYIGFTIVLEELATRYASASDSVQGALPSVPATETPVAAMDARG